MERTNGQELKKILQTLVKVELEPKFEGKTNDYGYPALYNYNFRLVVNKYKICITCINFMPKLKTKSSAKKRFKITAKRKSKNASSWVKDMV